MERIYVAVRARPLSPEESTTSPWRISGSSIYLANQPTQFDFDRIFGDGCKTLDIFEARTKEIVASVVRGFNGTVFAYGQTSSGKTYTMRGSINEPGIIPLSVHQLFCSIQAEMDREFLVRMSYMEIYNEEINDLLVPEHRKLQIHESLERGIFVAGLREEIVTSPEQVLQLMEFGESHRHIGQTNMNLYSSRSHTIFRMIVESRERNEEGGSINCFDAVRVSVLNLVDLAGSERAVKTGAEGMRLKEGSHINKSLMTLGTVIKKLSDGAENQGGHVPYRDSKLTRILQPALGGNSNTAMICNITISQIHADETKSSLLFASRALQVKNCACVNEILTDAALLKRQKKEIEELRAKLLSSHSEHLEEEILNLRNTLLQSELEKERIALELEEEKKDKAHRERRLLEQAMKIQNLSSLIFCSECDDKTTLSNKTKRRETWCPGPFQKKSTDAVSNLEIDILEPVEEDPDISLLHPFIMVVQESEAPVDSFPSGSLLPDLAENTYKKEDFFLPDAHALLNVTSRRKNHKKRSSRSLEGQLAEKLSEFDELCLGNDAKMYKDMKVKELKTVHPESESAPANKCDDSSIGHFTEGVSVGHNNLTVGETNAVLVIKQLEKQIKALEMEKTSVQANLDSIVTLATEHNGSLWGMCDEEINGDRTTVIYTAIEWIASDFDLLWNAFDNLLSVTEEVFQFLTMLSESLLSVKILPRQYMLQLKSIVLGHESINNFMGLKFKEVELEKNLLSNQLHEHQMQICELKTGFEKKEKEQGLQHDMEMDELLSQILYLQKEVSQLSSSSLARENEALRKEHDKKKTKLKDTECKLKNIIHDKVKLEVEKAQAECKIKSLQDQCAILERDILKRDSHFDKIRESRSDINKAKVVNAVAQQSFQVDYQRLEFTALELDAENASLKDALEIVFQEKEEALVKNEIIESELEAMAKKLNTAHFDMKLLAEDLLRMEQRAADFEASSRRLEDSLNLLSREKEEMILQLTEALLEVEAEKSQWACKEKIQSEKLKISNDETVKLSENLLKMQEELELCKDQRNGFRESLKLSEENTKREKDSSIAKSLEINRLRDELNRFRVDAHGNEVSRPNLELTSMQYLLANAEVHNLSTPLKVTREWEVLLSTVEQLRRLEGDIDVFKWKYDALQSNAEIFFQEFNQKISIFEVKILEEASLSNKHISELSMKLSSTEEKLRTYRLRFKEVVNERKLMDRKYQEASTMLKDKIRTYGQYVLDLTKRLAEKD